MKAAAAISVRIVTDPSLLDLDRVYCWLKDESYWARTMPRDVFDRAIRGSLPFGALVEGDLVGFARVITDGATFAYVGDVFVAERWRQRGIGRALIAAIVAHPDLQGLRRTVLVTRDAHALYAGVGFRPLAAPEEYMERMG